MLSSVPSTDWSAPSAVSRRAGWSSARCSTCSTRWAAAVGVVPRGGLVLGAALLLPTRVARGRGWHTVVTAACDEHAEPRRRDTVAAWVAGAGAGGIVSARGGDAVRVLVLARRSPGT